MAPHSTVKNHSNEEEEKEMAGKGGNTIHPHTSQFSRSIQHG
jgi:hypothetical protein